MKPSVFASNVLLALACAGLTAADPCAAADGRLARPLDGVWSFRLDPQKVGVAEKWFNADVPFEATVRVPGAWPAQGFGAETDKFRHSYIGQAWYKRTVDVPVDWEGRRIFLCIGGVHRYADVWVNGRSLGEHIGYLSPFEYELTPQVKPGGTITIAIRVDCEQRWDVDCLFGCFDVIDHMFADWGGIWEHVRLEARGDAWLEELFVRTRVTPAGCTVSAKLAGSAAAGDRIKLEAAGVEKIVPLKAGTAAGAMISVELDLPGAALWSPEHPELHNATLTLLKGDTVVDRIATRFGLREIRIDGHHFLLNGRRIYLRGYGDDAIYPETMAAPCDQAFYAQRLRTIKSYGFNYVRHHSHTLPQEYYAAADEVGMLVSAEFPIAYLRYYRKAKGPAMQLYGTEWAAMITRLRNHPSIFDWAMSNELWRGVPLAKELYPAAKALDPDRPVIDSDGLHLAGFLTHTQDRESIDFYTVQFDKHTIPLDKPTKYDTPEEVRKPALCHETGNFVTFPRLDVIERFTHVFKPFWLTPVRAKLEALGLLHEAPLWAHNSERLYLLCHKLNTEDLRKHAKMTGYQWWLFQDYWTGSNGLVNTYFEPKEISPEEVRAFNNDVVLLLDGLDVTARSGQRVDLKLLVSNYAPEALTDTTTEWQGQIDGRTVFTWKGTPARLEQGEVITLNTLMVELPQVAAPARLIVTGTLQAGGRSWSNDWLAWVYPADPAAPKLSVPLLAAADVADCLARYQPRELPSEIKAPESTVIVTGQLTQPILDAVARGACLLLLDPAPLFPTVSNRFKTAWWLGAPDDANAGTVVYPGSLLRPLAPEGWCDAGWYHLLEGSQAAVLDDLPAAPEVLVRALDIHSQCRSKAVLLQARVGAGCIIVCGLNLALGQAAERPERQWLLDRLIEYAGTRPQPKAELPSDWLRARTANIPLPEGLVVNGFTRLLTDAGEQTTYPNYRGTTGPMYVCRQTELGQRVEWETAAVPATEKAVTFRFAGGLGWRSEPEREGFALLVNDRELIRFEIIAEPHVWRSADGSAQLQFVPRRTTDADALGLFYLTLPAGSVKAGESCRVAVISKSTGSRRWFGLTP